MDVAGSRPYRPGDDVALDRLGGVGAALRRRDEDEFIVRERFADEAPRVVVLRPAAVDGIGRRRCGRSTSRDALPRRCELIGPSARGAQPHRLLRRCAGGAVLASLRTEQRAQQEPSSGRSTRRWTPSRAGLEYLGEHLRDLPMQTFVFVVFEFVVRRTVRAWQRALEHRWELARDHPGPVGALVPDVGV